jgi:ubiquinone/menaquinone biosynthesis C-methylase UbiE
LPLLLALDYCARQGRHQLVGGSLLSLPLRDGSIDVVLALDVIEHVTEDGEAVRELWRVCKPGGLLIVSVPAYEWLWSEHDDLNQHQRRYTRPQLEARVLGPQADCLKSSYFNTFLSPPIFASRLLRRLRSKSSSARGDFAETAPWLNRLLETIFGVWLRHFRFAFGVSVMCVARKRL